MNEPRKSSPRKSPSEERLDEGLEATFPASDPPANTTPTFIGAPARVKRPARLKPLRRGPAGVRFAPPTG